MSYIRPLRGRHFITTEDFTIQEIDMMLELSRQLKIQFACDQLQPTLAYKTLFLLFFDASTRTRNSMEAAMTQLGGHAHYLDPSTMQASHGETPEDTARVLSRFGHAIAIRHCQYRQGNQFLRNVAGSSTVPLVNMQDDIYHPLQVMADLMTMREKYGNNLHGLKVGVSWAYARSHLKPLSVPQSQILLFSRYGMDITLAYPQGFDLMPDVVEQARQHAQDSGGKLQIVHEMDAAFSDADVVIPKNWGGFFVSDQEQEIWAETEKHKDWRCDESKMALAKKRVSYMHALPADRTREVVDSVIDGPQSVVIDEAENRLHTAKAILTLLMGGK